MSVLGAISRQDKGTAPVLPKLETPPDTTGFFQNVSAGFTQAKAGTHSTQNAKAIYESRYYDEITKALKAEGEQATDMVQSPVLKSSPFYHPVAGEQVLPDGRVMVPVSRDFTNPFSEGPSLTRDVNPLTNLYLGGDAKEIGGIWDAVKRVRQRKPDFLKGYPDQQALDNLALQHRQADQAQAQSVTSRANAAGTVGSFIGGAVGSIASGDPEAFVGGIGASAAGKSVGRQILTHAVEAGAINTAAGVIGVPGQASDAERMGQPMTTGDMARSVGENALAGAILGTAHGAIPHVAGAVGNVVSNVAGKVAENLPAAVRDPIVAASIRAGTVKDRDLLHEFQKAHSPYSVVDTSTPTEKAAAHTVVRDVETQEQSPLQPQHVAQHQQNLSAIASALGVDLTPPDTPTTAPVQTPTVKGAPADYTAAINHAEGTGKNPRSTAEGFGQFTEDTWLRYAPKVTNTEGMSRADILSLRHDRTIADRATQALAHDNGRYLRARGMEDSPGNLSLAHFLGPADAAKVLQADPSTPVESILSPKVIEANHEVLRGKSADQVIAWAHKRIGAAVDHPAARPDAVPDEGYDPSSPVPYTVENLKPEELPPTSAEVPTDEPWDHTASQHLLVWEANDGTRSLMDGGKRLAHARSLDDQSISLPTVVLREKDGVSEEMAMLVGKLKNVNLGTVPLEEAAGTLADIPEIAASLRNPQFRREIAAIAQLPYEQFGAVVNGTLDPIAAAQIGETSRTPKLAQQIRDYWSFQKESGHRRKPVQVVTTPEGEIRTWAAANSERAVAREFRDGDTITRLKPDDHSTLDALLEARHGKTVTAGTADSGGAGEPPSGEGRNLPAEAPHENLSGSGQPSLFDRAIEARQAAEPFSDPVGEGAKQQTALIEHDFRAMVEKQHEADLELHPGRRASEVAHDRYKGAPSAYRVHDAFVDGAAEARGEKSQHRVTNEAEQAAYDAGQEWQSQRLAAKLPAEEEPVHLFDLPSTGFRLDEEGNTVSLKEAIDSADADEAAAKALRDCL